MAFRSADFGFPILKAIETTEKSNMKVAKILTLLKNKYLNVDH